MRNSKPVMNETTNKEVVENIILIEGGEVAVSTVGDETDKIYVGRLE